MNLKNSLLRLIFLFGVGLTLDVKSHFLELVKNSTLFHHKQTNTVWEYLGIYAQTENTINFILEVPVFQFMCDVFPASMAFAMNACTQYRSRILDNGSARRLNELVEAHVGRRKKRQVEEALVVGAGLYGVYKIVGDLFRGGNDEIIHRLDEAQSFQKHQEKLDDVLVTSILSLEDDNLVMLKSFKSLFDSVNATRLLIHGLLKMSLKEQRTFTGWAKFSLKSEMRRHYEQMISAFSRVANHDLNLEMFSPEQRTFVHDFLYNRIRSNLPLNFSVSLAQFVPNLLVQQIVSFAPVNESEILYELNEEDFYFDLETDSDDKVARNETIDLDSILPKIVGHARIENFFGIPTNISKKKIDLYKITRLPLFVDERKAVFTANLPRYISFGEDGSSSEWFDDVERRCIIDEKSGYTFCSIPVPIFSSIQHPCLRSIILNNSTKDCLKETVDLSSPHIVKFTPNIHAISVHSSLQCFEKGDKENKNTFSNITKVAIIKTRCNSFVSCGTLDFSSVGGACEKVESYIFTFNNTYDNPFKLDKSVNSIDVQIDNLTQVMDISSLIESALSHKKHLEDAHIEFQSYIHRIIKTKVWPKILIAIFILILVVTLGIIAFASGTCFKKICCFDNCKKKINCLFFLCIKKKKVQIDNSLIDVNVHSSTSAQKDCCYDAIYQNKNNVDQFQPLLNTGIYNNSTQYPLHSNCSLKQIPSHDSELNLNGVPLKARTTSHVVLSDVLPAATIYKKKNLVPRKVYGYMQESLDLSPNNLSTTSGEFFEEDRESDI